MPLRPGLAAAAAALSLGAPGPAHGYDVDVRAETIGQAYQVRGPSGAPVISSRRVTQVISLAVLEAPRDRRGVTVALRLRLRMDADFGEACDPATDRCLDEVNRARGAEFVPLFARRTMDVPYAYLDVLGVGRGALDVRAGRIFQADPLGFFLFDGARARLHLGGRVVLESYGGLETRAGFPLSNGRFERDGLLRADRATWEAWLAPYVEHRQLAPVVAFALETERSEPLYVRAGYRRVWTSDGVAEEKLGGAAQLALGGAARLYADGVYSVPQRLVATATLGGELHDRRGARLGLELARYRPVFDLGSIWVAFWADPTDTARLYGEWPLTPRVALTGWGLARRYALGEAGAPPGEAAADDLWNLGGAGAVVVRAPAYQGAVRARFEGGAVGARAGIDADAGWWPLPDRLRLDARLSLWHVEDELRPQRAGLTVGGVLGALVRFGTIADLLVNVEDNASPLVGHRFRLLAVLALRGAL